MLEQEAWLLSGEREELLDLLRESERESVSLIDGVSEASWLVQPASGGWSVGQIVEHLSISEGILIRAARARLSILSRTPIGKRKREARQNWCGGR